MYDTVIFDFDGTMADSEHAMIDSLNAVSDEFGFAPLVQEEIAPLRKLSIWQFARKRLGIPLWDVLKLLRLEKRAKEAFLARGDSLGVFPGIADLVSRLRSSGRTVGIVSSTPAQVVERVLRDGGITVDFVSAGTPAHRKAAALRSALRANRIDVDRAVYVGDEVRDIEACKRARLSVVSVGWGLNDAQTLAEHGARVASTPEELFSIITSSV